MNFLIFLPLLILAICFIIRAPLGLSMIGVGVVYLLISGENLGLLTDITMGTIYSNTVIVAIPLFIFAANIMNSGKVTGYMFGFTKALIGKRRGALAYINIIISLIFSGMTGSSLADASGIGMIEIREMNKDGYDAPFSCAISACTSTVGPIFPPSIPMVIYALIAGVSVGGLFMGGMIPAVLICFALGIYVYSISKKRKYPYGSKFTFREFLKYSWKALPALLTPVILLGGMYSGFVTPTEAGAIAALYTIIISTVIYKSLRFKDLIKAVKDTIIQTGVIIAILIGAYVMSYYVTSSGIGQVISDWFLGITTNKYIFLLIVNIMFLFLGMLFDTGVLLLVFVPLVLPIVNALDINLIHFGVILIINLMVGGCTPPYGLLCFITSGISQTPLKSVFKEAIPMCCIMILILLILTYIPEIVMLIPNLLM